MMDWKNIVLILVAGLNLGSSLMVYFRNPKHIINIYYSLFVFWISIWIFGLATFRLMQDKNIVFLLIYLYYVAAFFVSLFFCLFSYYFPYRRRILADKTKIFFFLVSVVALISVLPKFLVKDIILSPPNNVVVLNLLSYATYSVIFLFFTILAFKNLLEKLLDSDGIFKQHLKFIIYGSSVAYFFGILFNLIYPFFGNYTMIWLGPYFTVVMIIFLNYFLFFYKPK